MWCLRLYTPFSSEKKKVFGSLPNTFDQDVQHSTLGCNINTPVNPHQDFSKSQRNTDASLLQWLAQFGVSGDQWHVHHPNSYLFRFGKITNITPCRKNHPNDRLFIGLRFLVSTDWTTSRPKPSYASDMVVQELFFGPKGIVLYVLI